VLLLMAAAFVACFPEGREIPEGARAKAPASPPESLTVRVTGKEYGWEVRFPGADGRFGTADDGVAGPEFHLPVGIPTRLEVTSEDYLYLLKVPDLAIKVMAVPEMTMTAEVLFETPATGTLTGDPMCGFQHGELTGQVTVESWNDFHRWFGSLSQEKAPNT
jgi:cytochrome c oxidase subunit 2